MYCIRSIFHHMRQPIRQLHPKNVVHIKQTFFRPASQLSQQSEDYSEDIINEICKGDEEIEKKLRILMLEVEVMRQDGRQAPDQLRSHHWKHLMELPSRNQRHSYLLYLFKTERAKENQKAKKEARKQAFLESEPEDTREFPDDMLYGIQHQSLFLRIRDQSMNNFDNYRALQAIMHGQKVVIDCSYENNMIYREAVNAAKQMTFVFGDNRIHKDPFDVHMCNVNLKGHFYKQLVKNIPSLEEPWIPLNIHTESYLDVFPKDKLVYLTPHCRNELTEYDHDAIYIIGCMVDKVNNDPLSLAKAKRDGIKMAKLPLDRYLEWAPGSKKNLNINHMVPILLDLKTTGDWDYALRHVPRRKLMETKVLAMENKLKRTPALRKHVFKNLRLHSEELQHSFNEKRKRSKKSLYDDDSI
ncbi:mitochondrial ribonuclease P protein 1 homolog isoform X1 [Cydia strobilella]|uniref:mitochondrial ribonuclease P protein 1 homolog isoform X1 n=1 Tax=Cydia strobilella TaxID=1100964 RepID=UPI0030064AE1